MVAIIIAGKLACIHRTPGLQVLLPTTILNSIPAPHRRLFRASLWK